MNTLSCFRMGWDLAGACRLSTMPSPSASAPGLLAFWANSVVTPSKTREPQCEWLALTQRAFLSTAEGCLGDILIKHIKMQGN